MSETLATAALTSPAAAAKPVIVVNDVVHSFKGRRALDHVSFEVRAKSLHGFVGPNGAGKTTSLRIICTLLRPQAGSVRVFGHDVVYDTREVRKRIGFMPDHFSTYRQMTVYEYLDFFAAAYGLSLKQRTQTIDDVLALTDMGGRKDDLIGGLSRGMQQRVSLARVLVNDPAVLLLDEPASGLDPRARIELMEILKELRAMGKTIFISSHILSELAELCDAVTIIDRGKIKYSGGMHDLLVRTGAHPTYRLTLDQERPDLQQKLEGLTGVLTVEPMTGGLEYRVTFDDAVTTTNTVLRHLLDWEVPVLGFAGDRRHLNEAFMDLTERGVK
ncbi:MAG: ABC transporter ATP-binding protein [Planctomycetaceae bacterium]|nr:ABC transporter ATP-binding protein [Planctomycetaceae bacterium]